MPKELSVTYHAPKGDSKVVEMLGVTFLDGKTETIVVTDRALAKLQGNRHFECGEPKDHKPDKPERETEHSNKDHKGR
jgi:hypothetical protein